MNIRWVVLIRAMFLSRARSMMDWSGIMAGAAIALVPIMIVFICLQKYFVNGVAGAVKG